MSKQNDTSGTKADGSSPAWVIMSSGIALTVFIVASFLGIHFLLRGSNSLGEMGMILVMAACLGAAIWVTMLFVPAFRRRQNQIDADFEEFRRQFGYDPRDI